MRCNTLLLTWGFSYLTPMFGRTVSSCTTKTVLIRPAKPTDISKCNAVDEDLLLHSLFIAIDKGCSSTCNMDCELIWETLVVLAQLYRDCMDVSPITRKLKLLHFAVKNGLNWSCGLDGIVHMDDTAFFMKDNETGLLPFMLAESKHKSCDLETTMELLRMSIMLDRDVLSVRLWKELSFDAWRDMDHNNCAYTYSTLVFVCKSQICAFLNSHQQRILVFIISKKLFYLPLCRLFQLHNFI